eukprot:1145913-Pelagomonas_calceolata.AAC.5
MTTLENKAKVTTTLITVDDQDGQMLKNFGSRVRGIRLGATEAIAFSREPYCNETGIVAHIKPSQSPPCNAEAQALGHYARARGQMCRRSRLWLGVLGSHTQLVQEPRQWKAAAQVAAAAAVQETAAVLGIARVVLGTVNREAAAAAAAAVRLAGEAGGQPSA